jgi:hypothetical protein
VLVEQYHALQSLDPDKSLLMRSLMTGQRYILVSVDANYRDIRIIVLIFQIKSCYILSRMMK